MYRSIKEIVVAIGPVLFFPLTLEEKKVQGLLLEIKIKLQVTVSGQNYFELTKFLHACNFITSGDGRQFLPAIFVRPRRPVSGRTKNSLDICPSTFMIFRLNLAV